ncbi:MAG TPA: hypothetical protein VNW71_09250 [Thermoanaerobaculia bacterium]|nr:hypothetical protein [Thermoanaerobaculia bacterium]
MNKHLIGILLKIIGFILLTWIAAFAIVETSDIADLGTTDLISIMFGAASLALFVFSIFIALLAIVGWQAVKDIIEERVEAATQERVKLLKAETTTRVETLENELRGRAFSAMGYLLAEMSLSQKEPFEVVDRDRLSEALVLCEKGYNFLRRVGPGPEFMSLNNFVHYSLIYDDVERTGFLLEQARRLKVGAQEHNVGHVLMTACGAILRYGKEPNEISEAREILEGITQNTNYSDKKRREAKFYLDLASSMTVELSDTSTAPGGA